MVCTIPLKLIEVFLSSITYDAHCDLQTGGVASTADITAEVRTQHRKLRLQHLNALGDSIGASSMGGGVSGASSSVDRRTIDRTLQRLEHSLHHIASFPLLIPTGDAAAAMEADPALGEGQRDGQGQGAQEGEQVVLVVLASLEEEARQQAVEKYLARRFSTAAGAGGGGGDSHLEPDREFPDKSKSATRKRAAASDGKRQRRSRAAPSTGTDTGTGSARKKARVSVATRSWDSGSDDSASNYSDDDDDDASAASSSAESSSSSPLSAAEDSDSEDSTNADKRAGAVRGRGRGAATGEMLAGRTSRGVDQRKARKNALHQKKVLHDPHIFDNSNLLLPAPLTTSADVGSDGAPVPSPLLGLGEVESPGFLVRCLLFHHFLQACVLRVVSGPEAGGEHRREASALLLRSGEHVEVVLPALLLDLPLHYFLRTSAALRNALLVFFGLSSTGKQCAG